MMLRSLLNLFSPSADGARLSVLIFHRVRAEIDPLFPGELNAKTFESLVRRLTHWCNVLSLDVAVQRLRQGSLPERALCITFDDGYADNCTVALPILCRFSVPATFFIATGYIDGGRMWNDTVIESIRLARGPELDLLDLGLSKHRLDTVEARRATIATLLGNLKYLPAGEREQKATAIADRAKVSLPTNLMMTGDQVIEMRRASMTIGAHTVNHPILARTPDETARWEIAESKRRLQELLADRVSVFAYPNGKPGKDYGPVHVEMVREAGFDVAVSTAWGVASQGADTFQIPRFTPWGNGSLRFGLGLAQNLRRTDYAKA